MPVAKLTEIGAPDAMKSEEGNDSLDTIIRQAIGKEPFLSFSRTGDSPVQWIQLLHALDQPDLPGWPLLTPLKVQMQKCDKCSHEFCSPINYRRHIRMHRRSFNADKESPKNRDLLAAFWDKLSLDEAKDAVSFEDVSLEEVPGSSILKALTSFIRKPGFCVLPQFYVKAGAALLDILQPRPSMLPMSSQELFSILDNASERTFLCAGTAESMQKFVFDGEAAKIGLDMKNLVACTSFLVEQKLVKAWLADKDAEALRCQKLLVEEEEAAQKRHAEQLERKRQKKLRQKEQKAKDQSNEAVSTVTVDILEMPAETSSPLALSGANLHALDIPSLLEPARFSNDAEDADGNAQGGFSSDNSDSVTGQNAEPQKLQVYGHRHVVIPRWQVQYLQKDGKNGFHAIQNLHILKPEPAQKHNPSRDRAAPVNGTKVWTKKHKVENGGEHVRNSSKLQKEAMNQTDQMDCELMFGSFTVNVSCTAQHQVTGQAEAPENCSLEHAMLEKNNEKLMKPDSSQSVTRRFSVKYWKPVRGKETRVELPIEGGNQERENDVTYGIGDAGPSQSGLQPCQMDGNDDESRNSSSSASADNLQPEGLLFSSHAAKAFLAQRWKEAISGDHVKLVLSPEPEPPGTPDAQNECRLAASASNFDDRCILGNAENRLASLGDLDSSTTKKDKAKPRRKAEKDSKIKYVPK
ncbi:hypothetical protein RJ639_030075 [Escallonia herrerae]|uniref:C2H2-type domain-containing protein n=1 Tax=Escallonia herrerae TaxID=1293975 RepID=A0AA88WZK7_9ASTE|nr:hypothetical protein RJ639_030075 [Escallonia herrerae]